MARATTRGPSPDIRERLRRCRREMKKQKIDAFLITNPRDYFYLIGFTGEDSAVLLRPKEVHLLTDRRFDESSRKECPWATKWLRKGLLHDEIAAVCKKLNITTLFVQPDHMTLGERDSITAKNRQLKIRTAPSIMAGMRRGKSDAELRAMRKALRVAEQAFEALRADLRVGMTELEIAARLEYEMKVRGASGPSFPTIVAEGANAALPHAHPGKRKLRSGSMLLLDWGARVDGYCSDLTRVLGVDSMPPKIAGVYEIVLDAQERAIRAIRPGQRMCDVDAVARDCIKEAGYGEAFNHGLGHGLGLDVHEAPSLSWRSDEKLEAGMVVTVEPGVYLPGVGGVRIEDDVLVTDRGARVMSRLSKSLEDAIIRPGG